MSNFGLLLQRRVREQVVCEFSAASGIQDTTCESGTTKIAKSPVVYLVVTVLEVRGSNVKLAFKAPPSLRIKRAELLYADDAATSGQRLLTLDSSFDLVEAIDNDLASSERAAQIGLSALWKSYMPKGGCYER